MWALTNARVVIIAIYKVSDQHFVHLKLIQCYLLVIDQVFLNGTVA